MNFDQFVLTSQRGNLSKLLGGIYHGDSKTEGFVYNDEYYIEDTRSWGLQSSGYDHEGNEIPFPREKYYLCIGNQEWVSDDLNELEEILFEFSEDECDDF
jgi:hypothetical protein|tara:strand:- start:578 stop:877 length:300 start_codon:yes stop_codon:yes gene_type:complete